MTYSVYDKLRTKLLAAFGPIDNSHLGKKFHVQAGSRSGSRDVVYGNENLVISNVNNGFVRITVRLR